MLFDKQHILEFKLKDRYYITWRKKLKPQKIKHYFYNDNKKCGLKDFFPDKDIEYCHCDRYLIVKGDYKQGVKYVTEEGTYYMFWSANSFWAYPQDIAIGKAVDGKIYLINEEFPNSEYYLNFREIPEEYINKDNKGYRPKSYQKAFLFSPRTSEDSIGDEDVKCLKIAYEGIRAFNKLIEEYEKRSGIIAN